MWGSWLHTLSTGSSASPSGLPPSSPSPPGLSRDCQRGECSFSVLAVSHMWDVSSASRRGGLTRTVCDILSLPRIKSSPRTVWRLDLSLGLSQISVGSIRCLCSGRDDPCPCPTPWPPLASCHRILGCCNIPAHLPGRPLPSVLPSR